MAIRNILCPVDFSTFTERAVERACSMAAQTDAHVHFVHVYEPEFKDGDMSGLPDRPDLAEVERLEGALKTFCDRLSGQSSWKLIFGFPAGSLVGYAATNDIDAIVMGTHGRSGPSRAVMGSVAESVMRHAACPVIVVHPERAGVAA